MNNKREIDLQHSAAGLICYKLLNVGIVKSSLRSPLQARHFVETKSHLLILSTARSGQLVIDGRPCPLRPGAVFVCSPGQLVEVTNYSGSESGLLLLYFQIHVLLPEDGAVPHPEAAFPFLGEALVSRTSLVIQLFDMISSNWNEGVSSARLRCEAGLLELLSLVLGYQEQQVALALESARLELERHYRSEITIDRLAGIAGLSRYHFMRLFKERYGKGVMEYRTDLRLMEAKQLMEGPAALPLSSIAYQIGYKNENYFSSLFKKQTGIAPAVYQRNQKCRIAAYSWINFGQLLALQIIPFAAPFDQYWTDYYRNRYKYEVKVPLSHQYEFNREALRKAEPDSIIAMDGLVPPEEQEKLRRIAPALFLSSEEDWRQHLLRIAEFLGRTEEALQWLNRYNRKAAAVREQLKPVVSGDTVLVLLISRDQLHVWGSRAGTVLYDDLQLAMPQAVADFEWKKPIGLHELEAFHADRILLHVEGDDVSQAAWSKLSQRDGWRNLKAVRENRVHLISGYPWFEVPWSEYTADNYDRFIGEVPGLFDSGPF
ncbi:AraC family transcriptional regulator [Paenibacillus sepulcri]|uniref:AraC family transcriptional regulator n=1 Tax=Paenibacillus sepulcri TaxID=359917 RepID=A0ABS7C0S1_9BACL|nr:AraC family transcriptional regulator [Paenibacillus sepulcri]